MSSSSAANKSRQETDKSNKDSKKKVERKEKENKANFRTVPLLVVIFAHSMENRNWL